MKHYTAISTSTGKDTWATPASVFDPLHKEFDFGLDAAAQDDSKKVDTYLGPDHQDPTKRDALVLDWGVESDGKAVWLNPPYSTKLQNAFVKKAYETAQAGDATVVVLIPARTGSARWHDYIHCQPNVEVRFTRGRIAFGDGSSPAPFDTAVVIFHKVP